MDDSPFAQTAYQVRMEWGVDGMRRLAASDIVVVVDAFGFPATPGPGSGAWREPVVAGEGFRSLRGAVRHLLTASGAGRELTAAGFRDAVLIAAEIDASSVVPVLRDGVFVTV